MRTFTTNNGERVEFNVWLGIHRDFVITLKRYPADIGFNAGETWVQLDELVAAESGHISERFIFSHQVEDNHDLHCLRDAFNHVHRRLKEDVRAWARYRYWASLEKGGKRAYYTRHANSYRARLAKSAELWRLCKQLWKELVKL